MPESITSTSPHYTTQLHTNTNIKLQ